MASFYKQKTKETKVVNIQSIADISDGIYKPKKLNAIRIADIMSRHKNMLLVDDKSRAYRMMHCGDDLEFQVPYSKSSGEVFFNHSKLTRANFCRDRLCPMCQYRLSRKTSCNLAKCMKVMFDCKYSFLFLTLTYPNVKSEDLTDMIDCLFQGWSRMYHLSRIQKSFCGYFKSLETTYNSKSDSYHAHLHLLVSVKNSYFHDESYIKARDIAHIWLESVNKAVLKIGNKHIIDLMRTDFYETDIRRVKSTKDDLISACYEMSKYICKSNDIVDISFDTFFDSLAGVRSFEYIGDMKTIYKKLKLNDNIEDSADNDNDDIGHIMYGFTFDYDDMIYALRRGDK